MTGEDPTAIHVGQFLAHPPRKVWRALTEPALLERWLTVPIVPNPADSHGGNPRLALIGGGPCPPAFRPDR